MLQGPGFGCRELEHTCWPLLLDVSFKQPIERFTAHLAGEHEQYLDLACTPYQRGV